MMSYPVSPPLESFLVTGDMLFKEKSCLMKLCIYLLKGNINQSTASFFFFNRNYFGSMY